MALRGRGARAALAALALTLLLLVSACGGGKEAAPAEQPAQTEEPAETAGAGETTEPVQTGEPIVIGVSLPLTGPFERFAGLIRMGYETAAENANADGGLDVGGEKRPVELEILDDAGDPQKASENANTLILKSGAVALLGAFSPPLAIPMMQVAEARGVPLVVDHCPIRACLSAAPEGGWQWSWVFFFDELEMTQQEFKTMDMVESNHKVALFTDEEQDGQIMGGLWEENAPTLGYEVVYHASFPVGTTDYADFIRRAQKSGADFMISQMIPPDAIALWKQMKALGWKPKAAFMEKAGNTAFWWLGLEADATGTAMVHFWSSTYGYPETDFALEKFGPQTQGGDVEIAHSAFAYTAAKILFDAIEKTGSTDPQAINDAIAATDADYMAGHIKWDESHASAMPSITLQWQADGNAKAVYPPDVAETEFIYPLPPW